ncbi:heavy metal-binding domain-containing protein [Chryseobacterium sp. OSA05B]|uniref:heavy metal-binding domain-containing protein n=1 Tax=Chryseobacterium sp. OSA05B TaxID=2862650 RepID=UPI001CBCC679|nr:heavy metal-binding domain-containing protein [Chryseobacterium sp. OSA05B]
MKNTHHTDHKNVYTCPMHPEVTGQQGDRCPKCGMDLKASHQENSNEYQVQLSTFPQTMEAGVPTQLTFAIKNNNQNVPLEISHEMKVHLMAVSEDLTWFRHIHPEEQPNGTYVIIETFPNGGKYLLFTDFKPSGATQVVNRQEIDVQGNYRANYQELSNPWISKVDGYTVTLENGNDFKTSRTQSLEISVEINNRKLKENDLQPYLGASAHIVMISEKDKDFLHIHPVSDDHFPIYSETYIEKSGTYRMWVQFNIGGQVHTADFTVNVSDGK